MLNDEECEQLKNGMWSDIEHITQNCKNPIKKDDETTYGESV